MRSKDLPVSQSCKWCGMSAGWWMIIVIALIIVADQWLKIWVKTHMYLGEEIPVTSWFRIKFIENNGMAFGMELGSKILLTAGRIVAVSLLVWVLCMIRRQGNLRLGYVIALGLIAAGAAGNIFDCVFYGRIFNNPMPPEVAVLFPPDGGYGGWFEGRVVDMLYFPLFDFYWPQWLPIIGGSYFEFFQYIFNIADSAICVGFALLLVFYSKDFSFSCQYLKDKLERKKGADTES